MKTIVLLFLSILLPAAAWAEKVALVIGNSDYEYVGRLPNPKNDAEDVAAALERIGFDVTSGIDLDYRGMRLAVRDFAQAARGADVVFIYYAGHGIEIDNTNYLIPVNAELKSDIDVQFEAIRFDQVLDAISASQGLKIVLVDACRNNPFIAEMTRTSSTRSIGRGLARVDPTGVMVGYSARGGTLALDGDGRNSPYTEALLSHIEEPGLELGKMFRKIRDDVYASTDGFQEPFVYGSLPGRNIYLVPSSLQNTQDETAEAAAVLSNAAAADKLFKEAMSVEDNALKLRLLDILTKLYPDTNAGRTAGYLADTLEQNAAAPKPQSTYNSAVAPETVTNEAPVPDGPNAQTIEAALGLSRTDYTRMQRALNTLGFSVGAEDGVFGPRSRAGLAKYQSESGQDSSGYLTASAVSALRAVPLPRKAEPANDSSADATVPQTQAAPTQKAASARVIGPQQFLGNFYCRRDGRGLWDGNKSRLLVECIHLKSIEDDKIKVTYYWRGGAQVIDSRAEFRRIVSFTFPSNTTSQFKLGGKTYVRSNPTLQ